MVKGKVWSLSENFGMGGGDEEREKGETRKEERTGARREKDWM